MASKPSTIATYNQYSSGNPFSLIGSRLTTAEPYIGPFSSVLMKKYTKDGINGRP